PSPQPTLPSVRRTRTRTLSVSVRAWEACLMRFLSGTRTTYAVSSVTFIGEVYGAYRANRTYGTDPRGAPLSRPGQPCYTLRGPHAHPRRCGHACPTARPHR